MSDNKKLVVVVTSGFNDERSSVAWSVANGAIGSDMQVPGLLARAVRSLADDGISIIAMHQSMRQVDIQFIVAATDYEAAVRSLHAGLIEPHNYGEAICAA